MDFSKHTGVAGGADGSGRGRRDRGVGKPPDIFPNGRRVRQGEPVPEGYLVQPEGASACRVERGRHSGLGKHQYAGKDALSASKQPRAPLSPMCGSVATAVACSFDAKDILIVLIGQHDPGGRAVSVWAVLLPTRGAERLSTAVEEILRARKAARFAWAAFSRRGVD